MCELDCSSWQTAEAFLSRFGSTHFLCVQQHRNATSQPLPAWLQSERLEVVDGHPSRSVLPLVATLRRRRCDVLLIGTADTSAYARQSVLTDLPNALQLLKGRGLLILHGHDGDECKPAVVDAAPHLWSARQVAAARRRTSHGMVGCPAGVAAGLMCATPGYWCRYWEQLVQAGSIVRPECRGDTPTGMRSCAGELYAQSACKARPALLPAGGIKPEHIVVDGPGDGLKREQWRYFLRVHL